MQDTDIVKHLYGCDHPGPASGIQGDNESFTVQQPTCSSCGAKSKLFPLR